MPTLANQRLLNALRCQPVDATPIWIMRQAGRYLPEYRAIRQQVGGFMELCKTPELACQVTTQPLERFNLDAAILFSDILTIPDAMHLGLRFEPGIGPRFATAIRTNKQLDQLFVPDPETDLAYVLKTIDLAKQQLAGRVPLIGFSGSPWTLACYMIEGGSSKDFHHTRAMLYQAPKQLNKLLTLLTQSVSDYLVAQIHHGVDVVMLFDTWGGLLATDTYRSYSLNYMQHIINTIKQQSPTIPIIVFTKNGNLWLESIAQTGCDAIGIDWTIDIDQARQRVGNQIALQGNLDPTVLLSNPETIKTEVAKILQRHGSQPGHIFNLGHGILPPTPPEHVAVLVDTVHELSATAYASV